MTENEIEKEKMDREKSCGLAIRDVLKTHNCILTVPSIDISTGKILPTIQIRANPQPLPTVEKPPEELPEPSEE